MADVVDKLTRSRMMSGIRGKNTRPEVMLRSALHRLGFRYRLHASGLPGRPDLVLPKYRAAIQIHGCFWHRHKGCRFRTTPASNIAFWKTKFSETIRRDRRNVSMLLETRWRMAIVWECEIEEKGSEPVAQKLAKWLAGRRRFIEIPPTKKLGKRLL